MNLNNLIHQFLDVLFALGDVAHDAVFCRPAGFNAQTGTFTTTESQADCQYLSLEYRPFELGTISAAAGDDKVLIRAEDLAAIDQPSPGDYLLETATGGRRDILASQLDQFGEFWVFQTRRSPHEDWGGLATATATADWADLTPATEYEDYGTLI
jgi:hypothetical protein